MLATDPRVHVELFAEGRAVLLPAGIGYFRPFIRAGVVRAARCAYPLVTNDRSGIVHLGATAPSHTLGDLFAVWGVPLDTQQLLRFHGRVRVYVNGRRAAPGSPRAVPLRAGDEVVVENGPPVPPHPGYHFPPAG